MQHQRNMMRQRISKKFARTPGQHGDVYIPAYYPIAINPGHWGVPFGKVKDARNQILFAAFVAIPCWWYAVLIHFQQYHLRIGRTGNRPVAQYAWLPWAAMDDPDWHIKLEHMNEEIAQNKLNVRWGGTNFLASYSWMPGEPEPDIRRKMPVDGVH